MAEMTSRERVRAALELRQPDRVPIDIGGSSVSTIIGSAYEDLKAHLGIESETHYMKRKSRSAILDERIARRLHADTRPLLIGGPDGWEDIYFEDGSFQDEFQIVWRKSGDARGHYAPLGNPLKHATSIAEIESFAWPDPRNPGRTRGMREKARQLHDETDYAIVLTLPVGCVHLSQYLRGYEEFLIDIILNPEFLEALLDHSVAWWNTLTAAALDEVGPYVDVVMFGDDVAFDDRPMLDIQRYRQLIKPRTKSMIDCIKARTDAGVLYHTDGALKTMIDDFIDIGVDALNPIQVSSVGMGDTAELKALFGDRLCFWGSVDTSRVLSQGSPEEVRQEVRCRIEDLAPGGGLVIASVHNMQEDVPPENILAMADAAYEIGQAVYQ
jgi:uroporphyrinogen decarboxylase